MTGPPTEAGLTCVLLLPSCLWRGMQQLDVIFGLGFGVRVSHSKSASEDSLILRKTSEYQ